VDVGNSIRIAIDLFDGDEVDAAMLLACTAVDGTAAKAFGEPTTNQKFTTLLRDNYDIFGAMAVPGIDLNKTRFPVKLSAPKASGGRPDVADVIYGIHRCQHGHGLELPDGFELVPDVSGETGRTAMFLERAERGSGAKVALSDRVVFGLIAVAVLSPTNIDQHVPDSYYLTYGRQAARLEINDWWGRADDFRASVISVDPPLSPGVVLDFGDWWGNL